MRKLRFNLPKSHIGGRRSRTQSQFTPSSKYIGLWILLHHQVFLVVEFYKSMTCSSLKKGISNIRKLETFYYSVYTTMSIFHKSDKIVTTMALYLTMYLIKIILASKYLCKIGSCFHILAECTKHHLIWCRCLYTLCLYTIIWILPIKNIYKKTHILQYKLKNEYWLLHY